MPPNLTRSLSPGPGKCFDGGCDDDPHSCFSGVSGITFEHGEDRAWSSGFFFPEFLDTIQYSILIMDPSVGKAEDLLCST